MRQPLSTFQRKHRRAGTACLRSGYSMLLPQNIPESMSLTQSIALLIGTILVLLLVRRWEKVSSLIRTGKLSPDAKDSTKWEYPKPSPDLKFDLEQTPPPKFRAFRYSYTRHTIEVQKLDADSWVLLDNQFPRYHQAKVARLVDRGDKIVKTLPVAHEAAIELCQDLSEFLVRRYPHIYQVVRSEDDISGWYGTGKITAISIPALDAFYDLTTEDPLTVAGLLQPADLNVLVKLPDGQYQLSGMMLGIGGGQRLKDKLGKSLADLHLGQVPHYAEQLQRPLDRFLTKLKVESPICRNTTAISVHDELHWPTMTMGAEDDWDPAIRGPGPETESRKTFNAPNKVSDIGQLWFRQERQTLRRLPKSGAIVWAVHTYIEPLADVVNESGIPGRLASLIRSWDSELAEHKGRDLYADFLLPYLDKLNEDQVERGICEKDQLSSNFPF